ncbi:cytochrome c-type biogenesis protein CcmH [Fontimonas thermophila]|uniref:Cytochrome c-type biogenesis protein CcmH n=1 Tax=Fontimonas thermophila TaxID=1076937 RepID=A0A1I2IYV7_9GAMM|nr:c-type cytochrome biogenesis protein CcmI [Fontimonas thermophila]SFF45661.1 cytochrome c-type biogenesis protein CcmH [Fontimonas thermophila]
MSGVWMAAIVLLGAAIALWPLWVGGERMALRRRSLNVAAYRSRMAEIELEVEAGTITADAAASLRDEAALRLLADAASENEDHEHVPARRRWGFAALGTVLIVTLPAVGYYFSDSRELARWIAEARRDPEAAQRLAIDSMVQRLQTRLEKEPADAQGWAMLGRSYQVLGRYAGAVEAYERANRLTSTAPNASWLADEAEARLLLQGDHDLQGMPRMLFERALAVDPRHPKALWYAGLAAAQAGEYGVALDRWLALRDTDLPEDFRSVLDARLPELARLAGRELPAAVVSSGPVLTLDVHLDPALTSAVSSGDTLYVLARRPDAQGPPLAVRRLRADALPLRVTLDDRDAMAPGVKLSSADRWEVVARISRSGMPQAQSGDLEGRVLIDRAQSGQPVTVRIDRRLP